MDSFLELLDSSVLGEIVTPDDIMECENFGKTNKEQPSLGKLEVEMSQLRNQYLASASAILGEDVTLEYAHLLHYNDTDHAVFDEEMLNCHHGHTSCDYSFHDDSSHGDLLTDPDNSVYGNVFIGNMFSKQRAVLCNKRLTRSYDYKKVLSERQRKMDRLIFEKTIFSMREDESGDLVVEINCNLFQNKRVNSWDRRQYNNNPTLGKTKRNRAIGVAESSPAEYADRYQGSLGRNNSRSVVENTTDDINCTEQSSKENIVCKNLCDVRQHEYNDIETKRQKLQRTVIEDNYCRRSTRIRNNENLLHISPQIKPQKLSPKHNQTYSKLGKRCSSLTERTKLRGKAGHLESENSQNKAVRRKTSLKNDFQGTESQVSQSTDILDVHEKEKNGLDCEKALISRFRNDVSDRFRCRMSEDEGCARTRAYVRIFF